MMFSDTTGEGINYIAISGGSFCILPGLNWWHNKLVMIGSQPSINRTFSPANQFAQINRCNIVIRLYVSINIV